MRNGWGALPRGRAVPQAQARTRKRAISDTEEFDIIASEKWNYVASSAERAYCRDQYKVVQPYQGGDSDTMDTKEHPEHNQVVPWKRETGPNKPQNPMLNSGHRGLHGHGRFHRGLHGGILRRRRHGDNPNLPPHLMSQRLVLNTNERTPAQDHLLRNDSGSDFFFGKPLMNYEGSTHPMGRLQEDAKKRSCQEQGASCKRAENRPNTKCERQATEQVG